MGLFDRLFSNTRREARGPQASAAARPQGPSQPRATQSAEPQLARARGTTSDANARYEDDFEDHDAVDTVRDPDVRSDFKDFDKN